MDPRQWGPADWLAASIMVYGAGKTLLGHAIAVVGWVGERAFRLGKGPDHG